MCNAPTGLVDLSLASKVSGGSRPSEAPSSQPSASLQTFATIFSAILCLLDQPTPLFELTADQL